MSKTFLLLKTKPACYLESAGTNYLTKRRHSPGERLSHLCGKHNTSLSAHKIGRASSYFNIIRINNTQRISNLCLWLVLPTAAHNRVSIHFALKNVSFHSKERAKIILFRVFLLKKILIMKKIVYRKFLALGIRRTWCTVSLTSTSERLGRWYSNS